MRCTRPSAPGEEAELNCEVLRLSASRVWGALPNGPIRYSGRWGLLRRGVPGSLAEILAPQADERSQGSWRRIQGERLHIITPYLRIKCPRPQAHTNWLSSRWLALSQKSNISSLDTPARSASRRKTASGRNAVGRESTLAIDRSPSEPPARNLVHGSDALVPRTAEHAHWGRVRARREAVAAPCSTLRSIQAAVPAQIAS